METAKRSVAHEALPAKVSTPLDAPMTEIWFDLSAEIKDMIITESALAVLPLKALLHPWFHSGPPFHAIQPENWDTFKNALFISKDTRKTALRAIHARPRSLEIVDRHGYVPAGFVTHLSPSDAVLAHFDLLHRSMEFTGIHHCPTEECSTIDQDFRPARIKVYVPFPRRAEAKAITRIEITSEINPIPTMDDSEVKKKIKEWLDMASHAQWPFRGQSSRRRPLPMPDSADDMRALLRWNRE